MHLRRTSRATWHGTVGDGDGTMGLGRDRVIVPFSLKSRVGDQPATNPEELIAAAHAGCYAMSLTNVLENHGTPPTEVTAESTVHLVQGEGGFSIPTVDLSCDVVVAGVDHDELTRLAAEAERSCPVSQLLDAEITLTVRLTEGNES
ncbi:OsmC family peroxiredoxin [Phytoactinopolyspora limicola]|uniref:OsmC family peroxiredoxin n=1 Tax=Phytoactinopolyspora limicola TaxID=2715536 RepID=UPI001409E644|nr:OsmC family peroxiredoxin [Phytoactinopolyspora limicola]